jgi:NADH-quinone oxidoreductase subunit M
MPIKMEKAIKIITLVVTGLQIILAVVLLSNFNYKAGGIYEASSFQFIEKFRWIEITGLSWLGTIKVDYFLGVDGISMPMLLLTAFVSFIQQFLLGK